MGLGNSSGNLLLGAFVGFTITVVLTPFLPIVGHLIDGFVAGLIAKGGMGRGALAGFLAGIFGGLVFAILATGVAGIAGAFLGGPIGGGS